MALLALRESPGLLTLLLQLPRVSTMASTSRIQKGRSGVPSTLDADIEVMNLAKGTCGIQPAQIAFDSASALLTTIRVRSHLFRGCGVRAHVHSGLHSRKARLLGTWEVLR